MHTAQILFCESIRERYPQYFKDVDVLDIGSLDINGNNRYLFKNYKYTGVDVCEGDNVDIVCKGHNYKPDKQFDVVISTECFEHDVNWRQTIINCIFLTKSGGLFLFTCATTGRKEHGTSKRLPHASPATNDYYRNLTEKDIKEVINFDKIFEQYQFSVNEKSKDLYFWGIKK